MRQGGATTAVDKKQLLVLNGDWVHGHLKDSRLTSRGWFPLGPSIGWLSAGADVLVRFRDAENHLRLDPEGKIVEHREFFYLRSHSLVENLHADIAEFFLLIEGSENRVRIVVHGDDGSLLEQLNEDDPTLRIHVYDLPPMNATLVDAPNIMSEIQRALRRRDAELYSRRTDRFVSSPHILLALLAHVMELKSRDQIDFIATLRCVADHLRGLLDHRIVKLEKRHSAIWEEWLGARISFSDGGVARVAGLPGSEPLAIRVGVYTVVPGETDMEKREEWKLEPYMAGDIINSPVDPSADVPPSPDPKRLQEAARYILEALTILRHATGDNPPEVLFYHGPLVNSFTMYDEGEPNWIPAVDPEFLANYGITEDEVSRHLSGIPRRSDGAAMWNQCMAIYGYLLKRIFELPIPVVGVVERSASKSFRNAVLKYLLDANIVKESYIRKLRELLDKYRITDELLFGCILDEGEYIEPLILPKNLPRRARDHWQPVVSQYPHPMATYLKTSPLHFPYRVEINRYESLESLERIMSLLYHSSLLLPEYAFPVGLDITDKFVKVPDWISRGVSAAIVAQALVKTAKHGDPRLLQSLRRMLAQSPRDFYFRPRV